MLLFAHSVGVGQRGVLLSAFVLVCFTTILIHPLYVQKLSYQSPPSFRRDVRSDDINQFRIFRSPQSSLLANLEPNRIYITTLLWNGFANQFVTVINLIHIARRIKAIPIILPLTPGHISRGELNPFSTFYNLSSLSAKLNLPILELHQLKDLSSVADLTISSDTFACWAVWYFPTIGLFDPWPAEWNPLGLNITLWPTPSDIKSFEDLTRLFKTRPHGHVESLIEQDPKKLNGSRNNPIDTNLLCLSDMFYLRSAALFPTPVEKIDEKVWSEVGQHISFDNTLLARTVETLSRMGIAEAEPYIAIHIRRGDFCWWNRVDCNSNLDSYAVALEAVRSPSCPAFGATTVLVVTDDTSPEFLAAVAAHGWRHVNHANLGTLQTYGEWTITFIDSVIAAQAVGLVGTATSTFSTLAARRATLRHGACIEYAKP